MHPEIEKAKPGKCPLCHMRLVVKGSVLDKESKNSNYTPLLLIVCLILLTSIVICFASVFSFKKVITDFMIGFYLVFSGFKLIDLSGFAEGYSTYDLLAQKVFVYGYIYPFIELFFALAMILSFQVKTVLFAEIVIMGFSGIGVVIKLARHEKFHCVCLGTFLKVPLTNVTLIEDFGMALLAILLLILH
jgi:uncharacterized membrane protein